MKDQYIPTPEDVTRNIMRPDSLKLSGDQIFYTVQGEGISLGKPATFMRLQGCNLECGWCDTKYTWDKSTKEYWQEPKDWNFPDIADQLRQYPAKLLVVTGGEPLMQQKQLTKLIPFIPEFEMEIETNGTIKPNEELSKHARFNVSPKLENSGNLFQRRYKPSVLRHFETETDAVFKFVAQKPEDLEEVDAIVGGAELSPSKIMIMPEGTTQEAIRDHALAILPAVQDRGYRLTPRLQVLLWGSRRGV